MPAYSRHDHPWRRQSFAASAALLLFAALTACGSGDQEPAPQRTPAGPPSPATTSVTPPDGRATEPGHEPPTPGDGLDPRFDTCAQANARGYGPYYKGVDPEYDWYFDRDRDGIDCEPWPGGVPPESGPPVEPSTPEPTEVPPAPSPGDEPPDQETSVEPSAPEPSEEPPSPERSEEPSDQAPTEEPAPGPGPREQP